MAFSPRWSLVTVLVASGILSACGGGSGGPGPGGPGDGDPQIDPGRIPDLGPSVFHVTPAFGTPADGETTVDIELRLISLTGRPIGDATIELDISGCGNVWRPLPPTDVEGRTSGTLASTVGERKTLIARTRSGGRLTEFTPRTTEFLLIPDDTFFVRMSGSDANSGRSPRDAWQTLAHAIATVPVGATIHAGAGVYAGPLTIQMDSSATTPLVLSGDRTGVMTGDPGTVAIEAGGAAWGLLLRETRGALVQGLTLRGAQTGLRIEDCSDVRVLACETHENDFGIVIEGADGLVVQDCRVSSNRLDGLRVEGALHTRIENNIVYNNLQDGIVLLAPSEGTDIRYNTFHRNGRNHLREEELGGNGAIEGNILTEGGADPISLALFTGYQTGPNVLWANVKPGQSRLPEGSVEGDPLFVDPFGPDGILGGVGADDDDFRLLPGSAAIDLGSAVARDVVLGSRESLATRTTRSDDLREWSGADLPATNLGFHVAEPTPEFRSLAKAGARLGFVRPGEVVLNASAWDSALPDALELRQGPALDAEVMYLEQRIAPGESPEELVAAQVDTGTRGRILVRHWDGRRWSEPALAPFLDDIPRETVVDKRFDIEFEDLSGRGMLVLADGDGIPTYYVIDRGRWSPGLPIATRAGNQGNVIMVELVPHRGTDELALVTLDDRRDMVATLWDGSGWGTPQLITANTIYAPGWRPFDAAFESLSGDLLVTWGFSRFAEESRWATLERATGQWRTGQYPSSEAVGAQVILASDPASDRIACELGEATFDNDVTVSVWDGTQWVHTAELTLAGPIDNRGSELTWLGKTGVACAVFRRQGHTGSFNVAHFFPTTGWHILSDVVLPGVDKAAKVRLLSQTNSGRLLGMVLDIQGRLFGFRGEGRNFSVLNGGQPLATGLDPRAPGRAFDMTLKLAREPELIQK